MKKLQATLPTPLVATRNNPDIKLCKALGKVALLKSVTEVPRGLSEAVRFSEASKAIVSELGDDIEIDFNLNFNS